MVNIQFPQMEVLGIYPQACKFLRLPHHHIHSTYEKSIILKNNAVHKKDRIECFDDYFSCRKKNCKLLHVWNWLNLFIGYHNKQLQIVKWTEPLKTKEPFYCSHVVLNCKVINWIVIFNAITATAKTTFIHTTALTKQKGCSEIEEWDWIPR